MRRKEKIKNGKIYVCKSFWNRLPITKNIENALSLFIIESIIGYIIPNHIFVILEHRKHKKYSVLCKVLSEEGIVGWAMLEHQDILSFNQNQ